MLERGSLIGMARTALPTTYFIDANGKIVDQVIGVVDAEDFDAGLRAIS